MMERTTFVTLSTAVSIVISIVPFENLKLSLKKVVDNMLVLWYFQCVGTNPKEMSHEKGSRCKPKEYIYTSSYLQEGIKIPE
jgi:hypothetical protein